jgi:hypothetical protein
MLVVAVGGNHVLDAVKRPGQKQRQRACSPEAANNSKRLHRRNSPLHFIIFNTSRSIKKIPLEPENPACLITMPLLYCCTQETSRPLFTRKESVMQRCLPPVAVVLFLAVHATLLADRYVAQAGQTPASPYDAWSNAASNIQAAVNAAAEGETVWVSNGLYRATSTPVVSIAKSLSLRSVVTNSAAVIDGEGARRGILVTLSEPRTVLIEGFTVSNCWQGWTGAGGGIYLDNTAAAVAATGTVRNCRIVENRAVHTASGVVVACMHWERWTTTISSFTSTHARCRTTTSAQTAAVSCWSAYRFWWKAASYRAINPMYGIRSPIRR